MKKYEWIPGDASPELREQLIELKKEVGSPVCWNTSTMLVDLEVLLRTAELASSVLPQEHETRARLRKSVDAWRDVHSEMEWTRTKRGQKPRVLRTFFLSNTARGAVWYSAESAVTLFDEGEVRHRALPGSHIHDIFCRLERLEV